MTELDKIPLTSSLTIIGGSLVFVVQRFIPEPLNDQSKVLGRMGRIAFAVHYYGREFNYPIDPRQADQATQERYWVAADRLRELASSLAENQPGYSFVLGLAPAETVPIFASCRRFHFRQYCHISSVARYEQ